MNSDVTNLKLAFNESYLLWLFCPKSLYEALKEPQITDRTVYRVCSAFRSIGPIRRWLFGALNSFFLSESYQRYLLLYNLPQGEQPIVDEASEYLSILLNSSNPSETVTFIRCFFQNFYRQNDYSRIDAIYIAIKKDVFTNPIFEGSSIRDSFVANKMNKTTNIYLYLYHLINELNSAANIFNPITEPNSLECHSELIFKILPSMKSFAHYNYQAMLDKIAQIKLLKNLEKNIDQSIMQWIYQKIEPYSKFGERIVSRIPYYGGEQDNYSEADGFFRLIQALYRNDLISVLSIQTIENDFNKIVPLFQRHNKDMQDAFDLLAQNNACVVSNIRYVCLIFKFLTDGSKVYGGHQFFLYEEIKSISKALIEMVKAQLFDYESVREYFLSPEFDDWSHRRSGYACYITSFIPTLNALKGLGLLDGERRWTATDLWMLHDIHTSAEPVVRAIHLYLSHTWSNLLKESDSPLKIRYDLCYVAYQFFKLAQQYTRCWDIIYLTLSDERFDDLMSLFVEQKLPPLTVVLKRETEHDTLPHVLKWLQNKNCCSDLTILQAREGLSVQEKLYPFLSDQSVCPKFPAGLRLDVSDEKNERTERAFYDAVAILTLINGKEYLPEMWRIIIDYLLPWHLPIGYQEAKSTIECSIRNRMLYDKNFIIETMHLRLFQPEQYKELFSYDRVLRI